LIYLCD